MAVPDDFDFEQMMEERVEAEREAAYDGAPPAQSQQSTAAAALGAMASDVPDEHKKEFIEWQKKKMMEKMAADRVSAAVKKAMAAEERKMDAKMERMDEMMHEMMKSKDGRYGEDEMDSDEDDDDERGKGEDVLSKLREKRKKDLFSKQSKRSEWIRNGHGSIQTIKDQKDWFTAMKSTDLVIALFNNPTNKWGKMLREHLIKVAIKHLECKFIDMDVNDAPFLCERLGISVTPTLVDRKLIGLDWVAPDGKIDTLKLEQRLFEYGFFEDTTLGNTPAMGTGSKSGSRGGGMGGGSSSFQSDVLEDESSELDLDD